MDTRLNCNQKKCISVSMMCSRLVGLQETIQIFEQEKIEYLHIDVMDGSFVPNFGLGCDYINRLRELTNIPLDIHLMIDRPEQKLSWMNIKNTDIVSVHYESTPQIQKTIDLLKTYGCKIFLAINPATPIFVLEEILDYIDGVNVLMVNPGFAGQKIIPSTLLKVKKLVYFLNSNGKDDIVVEVDGNITLEYAKQLKDYGASMFVAGTSSLFMSGIDEYAGNIKKLRNAINSKGAIT